MEDTQYNRKEIIIVGAGGMARELENWLSTSVSTQMRSLIGFIDDNKSALNSYDIDIPILGGLDLSCVEKGHSLLFGIMSSDIKRKLVNKAKALNVNIDFFLHETVL